MTNGQRIRIRLKAFDHRMLDQSAVDIVETANGPLLMELELIEPHLFFDVEPRSAERLADLLSPSV